jgi:hypothetical protein
MPDHLNLALTLLASASVSAALCAALMWLARTWIGERLKAGIQHEYNQNLAALNAQLKLQEDATAAKLKGKIDREAEKLRFSAQSLGEVQKAAISKRLAAVEETWKTVLELNDAVPSAMSFLDILLTNEYLDAPSMPTFSGSLRELDHTPIVMAASARSRKLAQLRPYIGEYLWALFTTYQAVVLRTIYLIDRSKTEPKKLMWHEDNLIRQYIQLSLGDKALAEFDSATFSKVSWVMDRFTRAILRAMENIIAGKEFGEVAMQQAELMEAQLRAAKLHSQ